LATPRWVAISHEVVLLLAETNLMRKTMLLWKKRYKIKTGIGGKML
jgi:hypothetical protein